MKNERVLARLRELEERAKSKVNNYHLLPALGYVARGNPDYFRHLMAQPKIVREILRGASLDYAELGRAYATIPKSSLPSVAEQADALAAGLEKGSFNRTLNFARELQKGRPKVYEALSQKVAFLRLALREGETAFLKFQRLDPKLSTYPAFEEALWSEAQGDAKLLEFYRRRFPGTDRAQELLKIRLAKRFAQDKASRKLAKSTYVGPSGSEGFSIYEVSNRTGSDVTLLILGPVAHELALGPQQSTKLSLPNGSYRIQASAAGVGSYQGRESLGDSHYRLVLVIRTLGAPR